MAGLSRCLDTAAQFEPKDIDELTAEIARVQEDSGGSENDAALEAARRILSRAQTMRSRLDGVQRSPTRDQTETPEFKKWFGDSKVVDAEGKPLVVYHGTAADIQEFDPRRSGRNYLGRGGDQGFFFSNLPGTADVYAEQAAEPWRTKNGAPNTMPVYLRLQKPYVRQAAGSPDKWFDYNRKTLYEAASKNGSDGIIVRGGKGVFEKRVLYVAFKPEQIKSAIGNDGTFDPSNPDITRSPARWQPQIDEPSKIDNFIRTMQDKQIDTKRVVAAIKSEVAGIDDKWDPYLQEELYHGRTAKQTKDFLDLELRPLLQEMQARGVTVDEFETYLHNRHAEERNVQIASINPALPDAGSGIKTADAQAYLAGLPAPRRAAFEALAKRVDAMNRKTQALLVKSGLETQDTVDNWNDTYSKYVPLQRTDFEEDVTGGAGQGFSVRGSSTKRAVGSTKEVSNILGNLAMQRERTITRAEKNRVATALYGLAIKAPSKDFWYAFAPERTKVTPELQAELVQMGLNPIDVASILNEPTQQYVDPRTGLVTSRVNPLLRSAPNVVSVRVNGKDRFVLFNERNERGQRMSAALKNLDADQLGRVLTLAAKGSRWFAAVNTQYNPVFGVVNLIRDVQGALFNLSTTPIAGQQARVAADTMSAVRGIYSDIRAHRKGRVPTSKWAQLYEEFQKEGGQTGFRDMFATPKERTEALQREFAKLTEGTAMATGRAVFSWLSDYNETLENAVRLAAYKAGTDSGLTKQQAASVAKNLTVNFNRKGETALQAGALYAFFNASVQGTARLAQTLRGPQGAKILAGGLLLGVLQALALSAADFGPDEPPEFVKERSLVIPVGDGKYLSVPMPLGLHVIPSFSRIMTEWAMDGFRDTGSRVASIAGLLAETFNPIGNAGISMQTVAPTVLDPLAALLENKDFTGKPIAREDMNPLKPTPGYLRAKDTAGWLAKELSYYLNLASGGTDYQPGVVSPTPDQIEYLVGQVTGGVGRELMKAEQAATSVRTGEELPPNKVPLLGRFYGDTTGQASQAARFYSNIKKINSLAAEIDGRREARDLEGLREFRQENPEVRLIEPAKDAYRDLTKLKRQKRQLIEDEASPERIRLVEQRITSVMQRLNEKVDRLQP